MKWGKRCRKRFWSGILVTALALTFSGCGKKPGEGVPQAAQQEEPELVEAFVAEEVDLDAKKWMTASDMRLNYSDIRLVGNYLYYSISNEWNEEARKYGYHYYRYDLSKGVSEQATKFMQGFGNKFDVGKDGSIYEASFSQFMGKDEMYLIKKDAEGGEIYKANLIAMSDVTSMEESGSVVSVVECLDGGVCLVCGKRLFYLDGEGNYLGSMDPTGGRANAQVLGAGRGKDGKIYVVLQTYAAVRQNILLEADFDRGECLAVNEDFSHTGPVVSGAKADFLINDPMDDTVYDYNVAAQTREKLFCWTDLGYPTVGISLLGVTSDGKVLALRNDLDLQEGKVLLFSKKLVPRKQEIVLGTVSPVTVLRDGVAKFNRASSKYCVVVKDYMEGREWSAEAAEEAWTKMNLELVSGKGPDIIDLKAAQLPSFTEQGFLEDLGPYLEQSTLLSGESFVGHVLESGMCGGRLVALPKQFQVSTLVGHASEVGKDAGWTLDEFMALVEKHPGAQVLNSPGKSVLLNVCLKANMDEFVNRETGKCSFDSPEFIRLLQFADRYGDVTTDGGDDSMGYFVERIQNGDILMNGGFINELTWIQLCDEKFAGDTGIVGYPTKDGSAAHYICVSGMCGIAANSQHKEGAWAFLEYYVTARYPRDLYDLPAVQSCLDDMIQEETSDVMYKTDEDGELILDEKGKPIRIPKTKHITYYDNWEFERKTLSQEDADRLKKIFETALPESVEDAGIRAIIEEETVGFFGGSKSAEQVAGVIQNRVQLYMNENF